MKKIILFPLVLLAVMAIVTGALAQKAPAIRIGINAGITGDIKYRPDFPERLGSIEDARVFCQPFFRCYN